MTPTTQIPSQKTLDRLAKEAQLVRDFSSGTDELHITSVYAQSRSFVVFRVEAHKYWNGRWTPRAYAPQQHVLTRKGHFSIGHPRLVWLGRITKKKAEEIQAALGEAQKTKGANLR